MSLKFLLKTSTSIPCEVDRIIKKAKNFGFQTTQQATLWLMTTYEKYFQNRHLSYFIFLSLLEYKTLMEWATAHRSVRLSKKEREYINKLLTKNNLVIK